MKTHRSRATTNWIRDRFAFPFCLGLGSFVVSSVSAQNGPQGLILPAGEETLWNRVEERYWKTHQEPTEAVPLERLIAPWEATRAITLAAPVGQLLEDDALCTLFQDTIAATISSFEVVVFYHRLDERLLGDWLAKLEGDERISGKLERLHLVSSDAFSIWMRDFGPQFGIGQEGEVVVLDAGMLDGQASLENLFSVKSMPDPIEQHLRLVDETNTLHGVVGSDRIPSLLASFLESRWHEKTALSRPPLILQGGDFLIGGEGTVFTSYSTLQVNGGRAEMFRSVMKAYYGAERVVFLENLPGKTIDHLDFTINPIRGGVVLVTDAPESMPAKRSYHRYLKRELERRSANNARAIQKALPRSELLHLPMLPPLLDSDEEVRREAFLRALERFAAEERLALRIDVATTLAQWDRFRLDSRIEAKLLGGLGLSDWRNAAAMERIIERYLGEPFEAILDSHVEAQIDYRSYANSLYMKHRDGTAVVLVPRFRPANDGEVDLVAAMERQVEAVYAKACPDAEFVWIDCSVLSGFLGMVHCYTGTIPDFEAIR